MAEELGPIQLAELVARGAASDGVALVLQLEARASVRQPALVGQVVRDLVQRAVAEAPAGSKIVVSTRDVERAADHRGAPGAWVEVVVQEPGNADAHARGRIATPLLVGREGEVPLLDVSRTPGRGTTIRLLLPSVPHVPSPSADTAPVILLAEDDPVLRESLAEVLRERGYRVLCAANGQAALESVDVLGRPVDMLLTDVMMPRMSGIELARRLGARQPGLKVLFLSALPLPRGAVLPGPFVSKPLDLNVLLQQVPPLVAGILGRAGPPAAPPTPAT